MIDFMENHSQLAKGILKTANGKSTSNSLWKTLVEDLNAAGPPTRDVAGWKKVWADYKNHLKSKLRKNKNSLADTGGGPSKYCSLTPLEEQVERLMAMGEAIDGTVGASNFGSIYAGQDAERSISSEAVGENFADCDDVMEICLESNENATSQQQTPVKRTRRVSKVVEKDALLRKQVENQATFHADCLSELGKIHDDLKYLGKHMKKNNELKEKKLKLQIGKFNYKKEMDLEKRKLMINKLKLKQQLLEIKLQRRELDG
ncbi:PREDICTED: uncharacterized protein LOC108354504 isoform X2 [Rhagoletis zephyria]|nr:PREDICTED: uncharacterized protein LOC108354504 isoform X2 [Rhagoletis zephyria]